MRNFHIPFDMHAEDKIIGGYISLRQFGWLLIGGFVTAYLLGIDKSYMTVVGGENVVQPLNLAIRIIISLVAVGLSVFLSFFVLEELSADKFVIKKRLFMNKKRIIKYTDRK